MYLHPLGSWTRDRENATLTVQSSFALRIVIEMNGMWGKLILHIIVISRTSFSRAGERIIQWETVDSSRFCCLA